MAIPPALASGFLALLCFHAALLGVARADEQQSVSDIRDFMYQSMAQTGGWYKLLNSTSEIGSQAPVWGQVATAVLANASQITWPLTGPLILVCSFLNLAPVLQQLLKDSVSQQHTVGVLVDTTGPLPSSFSSSSSFPGSFNAPYPNQAYVWNPAGLPSPLARAKFNFPVLRLSANMSQQVAFRAQYNYDQDFKGTLYWGRIRFDMSATSNSTFCLLTSRTCKLLGGLSVWAAMPPMQPLIPSLPLAEIPSGQGALVAPDSKPITLVTAQIDSNSLFHDYTQGSDSPLSGLISLLAAMELLRLTGASSTYTRQLVFIALGGETWDYMGSRRLMWEMEGNGTAVSGLDLERVDQVIEVGQVGRSWNETTNTTTLYLHRQPPGSTGRGGQPFGDAGALVNALQSAAANTSEVKVSMLPASSSNPGIPPSSLMTFLRHKPSIQGVVLTEFDRSYLNPYHESELDTGLYIDIQGMVGAALTLARTLHTLASPAGATLVPLKVDIPTLNSLVLSLALCLMVDGQPPAAGLWCGLVSSYLPQGVSFSNSNAEQTLSPYPWRYVGLAMNDVTNPTNQTAVAASRDIFKFLFSFMSNTTASAFSDIVCDPFVNFCPPGMICAGWGLGQNVSANAATMGRCQTSTTRLVRATTTRLTAFNQLVNESDPTYVAFNSEFGWPADPMWSESDWPGTTPSLEVYMKEARSVQVAVLVSGLLLTLATGLAALLVQKAFEKRLKSE